MYGQHSVASVPQRSRTQKQRVRLAAAGCAAALALAGCGDNGDASSQDSALAEYLGYGIATDGMVDGPSEISEADRQLHYALEESVADCMSEHGFEYVPVSLDEQLAGGPHEAYQLDPEEFAAQYGYGVTTLGMGEEQPELPPDPNEQIRTDLSSAAQEEYLRVMWGDMSGLEPDDDGVIEYNPDDLEPEDQGCRMRAQQQVHGDGSDGFPQFDQLFQDLGQLYQRLEDDPRLNDAHRDWAACMTEAGFDDLRNPQEAQESVFERTQELHRDVAPQPGESGSDDSPPAPAVPDPAVLEEIRSYELEIAQADFACQREHLDTPRAEVAHELETEFVEQHRSALEEYRDWRDRD